MSDVVDPAPRRPLSQNERRAVAVLLFAFAGAVAYDLAGRYEPVKWSVPFIVLAWIPLLVVHELGHAFMARIVGWRVHKVVIGFGADVWRFRIGATRVVVKRIPAEGFVVPIPNSLRSARLKNALVYSGGALAELAVLALVVLGVGYRELTSASSALPVVFAQSVCVAIGLGLFFNLVPRVTGDGKVSDGLGIFLSHALSREHFAETMAGPHREQAERLLERDEPEKALQLLDEALAEHPEAAALQAIRAICLAASGRPDEASSMIDALEASARSPRARLEALHARGRVALEAPEPSRLRDGEIACDAALEIAPGWTPVEVTLGAIRLLRGRAEEAMTLLAKAHASARDTDEEARSLGYLALAANRLGRSADALLFLGALEELDASPRLVRRVRAEIRPENAGGSIS
jgi:tetratricopeptide (TPR) repeat protein